MAKKILFVHSAGSQGKNEGSDRLVAYVQATLGKEYGVVAPAMPEPENPRYLPWKNELEKQLASWEEELILIGHSLGGSVLLKYLSEENIGKPIKAMFLIAAPFWGAEDWQIEEFMLKPDFLTRLPPIHKLFLYHSKEDEWVPFSHIIRYAEKFPKARVRMLEGDEHEFYDGLPELIEDINNL